MKTVKIAILVGVALQLVGGLAAASAHPSPGPKPKLDPVCEEIEKHIFRGGVTDGDSDFTSITIDFVNKQKGGFKHNIGRKKYELMQCVPEPTSAGVIYEIWSDDPVPVIKGRLVFAPRATNNPATYHVYGLAGSPIDEMSGAVFKIR